MKTKTRTALVVELRFSRRVSQISDPDLRPYFLPYRGNSPRVFEFMKCQFLNSDFQTPLGALVGIKKASPEGVFKREGMKRFRAYCKRNVEKERILLTAKYKVWWGGTASAATPSRERHARRDRVRDGLYAFQKSLHPAASPRRVVSRTIVGTRRRLEPRESTPALALTSALQRARH
jgi:hypothetical protein